MKRQKLWMSGIVLLVAVMMVGLGAQRVWAESNIVVGNDAKVELDFKITIPQILYLQVGRQGPGNIDTISCSLTNIPGTGAVPMSWSGGIGPCPVRVAALVPAGQAIRLLADSHKDMTGGGIATIPFKDQISWTAGGGTFSPGTFNGDAAQLLDTFHGSGDRNGTYAFSYANDTYYDADTYSGAVFYTLSSP